ncbi:MAG: DUF4242 domain-containing protein [Phenylobacterium sp.]
MKKYVIERAIPGVEQLEGEALRRAASASNSALAKLAPRIQWVHSYVTKDKTFCIYLAEDEEVIREHSRISQFPATKITEVTGVIDPTAATA